MGVTDVSACRRVELEPTERNPDAKVWPDAQNRLTKFRGVTPPCLYEQLYHH